MNAPLWILAVLLIALNIGDWWTTRRGLALGATEANPLMAPLIKRIGMNGVAVVKAALVAIAAWFFIRAGLWWALALMDAWFAYACWRNSRIIARLKDGADG